VIYKVLGIWVIFFSTSIYGYEKLKQYSFNNISIDKDISNIVRDINAKYGEDFSYSDTISLKQYIEPSGISNITYKRYNGILDTSQTSQYPTNIHGKNATDVSYPANGPVYNSNPSSIHSKYIHFNGKKKFFPCFTPTFSFIDSNTMVAPVFTQKYAVFTLLDAYNDSITDHLILPGRNLKIQNLIGNAKHYQFSNTDGGTYYDISNKTIFIPIQNKVDKNNIHQEICIIPTHENQWKLNDMYFLDITSTIGKNLEDSLKLGSIIALTLDENGNIWMAFTNSFLGCIIPKNQSYPNGKLIIFSTVENFNTLDVIKKRYAISANIEESDLDVAINKIVKSRNYSLLNEQIKKNTSYWKIMRSKKKLYRISKEVNNLNSTAKNSILSNLMYMRMDAFGTSSIQAHKYLYRFEKNDVLNIHQIKEERIQNSITYGYGALFAVTNFALYGFTIHNDSIYSIWDKQNYNDSSGLVYDNKFLKIPGHLNTGSGTTPTLFSHRGVKFVGITDNNFPYINLSIYPIYDTIEFWEKYQTDSILKKQVLAGHKLSSFLNLFTAKGSACENSIVALTLDNMPFNDGKKYLTSTNLIIGNTFGYNKALTPVEKNAVGGLTCYQLYSDSTNSKRYFSIIKSWDNYYIDVKTATPKLAINDRYGYIYAYKKDAINSIISKEKKRWQLAAIDFSTGLERFSYTIIPEMKTFRKEEPIGQFFKLWMNFKSKTKYQIFNNIWGTYTFVGKNKIYIGTIRGILIIQN
jgi:hypothetical protein